MTVGSVPSCCRMSANAPPPPQGFFRIIKTQGGGASPKTPSPPPQTKVTTVGKNEIYNKENMVRPFLVHQVLGPKTPPPLPPLLKRSPAPPLKGNCFLKQKMFVRATDFCLTTQHLRGVGSNNPLPPSDKQATTQTQFIR